MSTKIYGASDDLVEFEGDVRGECNIHLGDDPGLVFCSDGTVLSFEYNNDGQWKFRKKHQGSLYKRTDEAADDTENYSDVVHFAAGLKWAYVATDWEKAK